MVFISAVIRNSTSITPKQLYKRLLRDCEKLPKDAQKHYKHAVKQSFIQHVNEPDQGRVNQIMEKALQDADWILNKYASKKA